MSDSAPATSTTEESPVSADGLKQVNAVIDASCRWPALVLVSKAVGWLVIGLVLAVIASIKFHGPGFLADVSWLTLGRVRPAAMNALVYGFASQAGLAVLIWMLCRLGRTPLLNAPLIVVAAGIWNLALFVGLIAILAGNSTGFELLEMPTFVAFFLFVAYTLIAVWALISFHYRRQRESYVSVWYVVAALFWFPWVYSAGNYLLLAQPVRGVMQAVVNGWFKSNLLHLWLGSIALASIYYFIPKLTGRQLYSRSVALFGFWTMALFGPWTGLTSLVGGPLPTWMPSASIAAQFLMLVPLACVATNWHYTLQGRYGDWKKDTSLAFVLAAAICYVAGTLEATFLSVRSVSAVTHFTLMQMGWTQLMLLGFVGCALFAGVHYMLPRVLGVEWSTGKMRTHCRFTVAGVAVYVAALNLGGLIQGIRLSNPEVEFVDAVGSTKAFLGLATLGLLVVLAGQFSLLAKLISHFWRTCLAECCSGCCSWLSDSGPGKKEAEA